MESVKWAKANPTMDNSDNHFYQCVADVTLIDDLTFRLVSNSMFLDVMCKYEIIIYVLYMPSLLRKYILRVVHLKAQISY